MAAVKKYTMAEIATKTSEAERWLILDGKVYDVTKWVKKHPGGRAVIANYGGEDATEAFHAMHPDPEKVAKYLKPLYIGDVADYKVPQIDKDFRELRETFEKQGLFKPSYLFFFLHLAQLVVYEVLAYKVLTWSFGLTFLGGWPAFLLGAALLATSQSQAGWLQHDVGHYALSRKSSLTAYMHLFVISFIKGASSKWWNYRHFLHHGKPNVTDKDPDITLPEVFVLGTKMPLELGKKKQAGLLPYNWQHLYYHILGPMTLLPGYFHFDNLKFVVKRKYWKDIAFMLAFFARHHSVYVPVFGWGWSWGLYFITRSLESHWFVWVTQMSHLPMEVDHDQKKDWVTLQCEASCNVEPSFFNDWFTGHLNFQIEHHLFPMMPRHNYIKTQPLIKSLCAKHGIKYTEKTLAQAFRDIPTSLEASGQMWLDAYNS